MRRTILLVLAFVGIGIAAFIFWDKNAKRDASLQGSAEPVAHAVTASRAEGVSVGSKASGIPRAESKPTEWGGQFSKASDYFSFIQSALTAATSGDPRAQYFIGLAVRLCRGTVLIYRTRSDPKAAFEQTLTSWRAPANELERMKETARREFSRCERIIKEDPFAALPAKGKDGYSYDYWESEAIGNGDPLAEAAHATLSVGGLDPSAPPETKKTLLTAAAGLLQDAVLSGDSAAIMSASNAFMDHSFSTDPHLAIALILVACDRGFDCSPSNRMLFGDCLKSSTCAPKESYAEYFARIVPPSMYAEAYALSQRIGYSIQNGDRETIAQLIHFDP